MEMHALGSLLPALEARRRLLAATIPVARIEEVPVDAAVGRVAAVSVTAPAPVPAFARATWDGYAVRARDTRAARAGAPVRLRLVGAVYPESPFGRRLHRGETVAIATGGAIPDGADSVAIFERVARDEEGLSLAAPVARGDRIAWPGSDLPRGARLVEPGAELTPVTIGALAAAGRPSVRVWARPVVEVIPNGNELRAPGAPVGPGLIHESNNATLGAVLRAAGVTPRLVPPLPDDPTRIARALRTAIRRSDMVLATGGSSVGERDYLPRLLPKLGRLLFHGIAVRPGKPTLAAVHGDRLIVGLPGHPASCLSNMYWLVLPVLRRLAHRAGPGWGESVVPLGAAIEGRTAGFTSIVPVALRGGRAYPTFRGSSHVTSLARAVGFVMVPPGTTTWPRGRPVRVCRLPPPLADAGPPPVANL